MTRTNEYSRKIQSYENRPILDVASANDSCREGEPHRRRLKVVALLEGLALCLFLMASTSSIQAQNVTATVAVGQGPGPVAVNYRTNQVFVGNTGDGTVSVIDGATATLVATVSLGSSGIVPTHIAVNEATNQIYVAASGCSCVIDIDGSRKNYPTTTIPIGSGGGGIDVNQFTNMIYAGNAADGTLSIIDGSTNLPAPGSPVTIGTSVSGVVVNPLANLVFVSAATSSGAEVYVLNGADNSTVGDVAITSISDFAVNSITNKVFAIDPADQLLYVIDPSNLAQPTTLSVASDLQSHVVVNSATSLVYVSSSSGNTVTSVNLAGPSVTPITLTGAPASLAVNPTVNKIYAANSSGTLAVIDGATNAVVYVPAGDTPVGVAADPITDKAYVINQAPTAQFGSATVVDGSTYATASILAGEIAPGPVATNPVTNQVYVDNFVSGTVELFNGSTLNVLANLSVGGVPDSLAVDLLTNKAYVANSGSNQLTVVDGTASTATNLPIDEGYSADVNPVTDMVYTANYNDGTVSVMDGRNNAVVATIPVPAPTTVAVDTANNQVYVASNPATGGVLYDLDGNNSYAATVVTNLPPVPAIADLAVNPIANQVFVLDAAEGMVYMIDAGSGNALTSTPTPIAPSSSSISSHLVVNPTTNQVYVTNPTNNTVTPLDGYSLTPGNPVPTNGQPYDVAVDSATNRVYVTIDAGPGPSGVAVIDAATNTLVNIPVGSTPSDVAVNPVTQTAYVTDRGINSLISVREQQVQALPLTTSITPIPGNQVANLNPTFTFMTSGAPASNVYYQVDTLEGPWMGPVGGSGGTFTTDPLKLVSQGTHIIYFFATDGEGPTAGAGIGNIAAYLFVAGSPVAPMFTSSDSATFSTGVNNSFIFTVSGFPATPGFSFLSSPALPAGLTFTDNGNGSATLSGNPATTGSYTLTVTASNGVGTAAQQTFYLTIDQAPVFTSAATTTFAVGSPGSFTVTATGIPSAITLSLRSASPPLPSSVSFNATTGVLSGTPAPGTGGVYYLTFGATNGVPPDAVQSFTLDIQQSPTITSTTINPFVVGYPGTFQVQTTGLPTPTVTLTSSVPPLPVGVTFTNGVLSGTPAPGSGGTYTLTFGATNGIPPDATQTLTLTVDVPPVFTSAPRTTFVVGTPGTFQVTATGLPAPSLELSVASPGMPGGVTFNSSTGVLSGTPTQSGVFVLTFDAYNGVFHAVTQSFTLTIDQAPAFVRSTNAYFAVNRSGSFRVVATGYPQPALSVSPAPPAGLTFNPSTQTLSGTPTQTGTYLLTFTATNSTGTANQNVTVSVVQAFQAPTITSASSATFIAGVRGSFTVVSSGTPPPTLTISGSAWPGGLTFTDNGNGTATLAGTTLAVAKYPLKITATNSAGVATQSFTVSVIYEPTTNSVKSSVTPSQLGQPVTFTATVGSGLGAPPNGELVTFYLASAGCKSPATIGTGALSGGVATYTTSSLPGGTLLICAAYAGDGTFAPSTSPTITQVVNKLATSTTVTSSLNPSIYGQSVTLTATVTGTGAYPLTGNVVFKSGSTTVATVKVTGGIATYKTSTLSAGSLTITATYNGDAYNAVSTSANLPQTVTQATTTLALSSSPNPSKSGATVKFTAVVTSNGGSAPTGSVTFTFGTTSLGKGTLNGSGTATLSVTTLPSGSDTVVANYPGTPNLGPSSNSVVQTVQ